MGTKNANIVALDLTAELFKVLVLANMDKAVLVDFWAPWCSPCLTMGPVLDQIATEQHESLDVYKVNVDEEPILAVRYNVASVPTTMLFVNGKPVKTMVGAQSKQALLEELYLD